MTATACPDHPPGRRLAGLGRFLGQFLRRRTGQPHPVLVWQPPNRSQITSDEQYGGGQVLPPLPHRRRRLPSAQETLLLHDVCTHPGQTRAGLPHAHDHAVGTYVAVDYAGWVTTDKSSPDPHRWRLRPTEAGRAALQRAAKRDGHQAVCPLWTVGDAWMERLTARNMAKGDARDATR